jgi:hypothetical protein
MLSEAVLLLVLLLDSSISVLQSRLTLEVFRHIIRFEYGARPSLQILANHGGSYHRIPMDYVGR